jgi:hypothetical protein
MRRLARLFALLPLAMAWLPVAGAVASPYPVTSTADTTDTGTLRWAIDEANDHIGADSIPVEVTGTIELETALPPITDDLTIVGTGADDLAVERDAAALAFRIFEFIGADVTVSDLAVRSGFATTGAGILNASGDLTLTRVVVTGNEAANEGGGVVLAGGGGILSTGSLTLRESFVHDNAVTAGGGEENVAAGGGVEAEGQLTVERSTISGNVVQALAEGGRDSFAFGGGLEVPSGVVWIEESTISGNSVLAAEGPDSNVARGGGVQGTGIALTGSTVTGNSVAVENTGDLVTIAAGANLAVSSDSGVRNSIVSDPVGSAESCADFLPSGGYNLDEDGSCEFAQSSDLVGVAAGLDPELKFNGGPTPTHALFENSIAVDRGKSFGSKVDQRGLPRPSDFPAISNKEGGDGSDIGAFELQAPPAGSKQPPPPPIIVSLIPGDKEAPNTRIVKGPARVTFKRLAKITFNSTEAQSTFQCKFDGGSWRNCRSPWKRNVAAGAKHVFKVRATDRFGNVDPTPARFGWRVKRVGG